MAGNFLKESRSLVLNKIKSTITDNTTIAKAMCYSALAESKMIRAGLVFAFGKNNKELGKHEELVHLLLLNMTFSPQAKPGVLRIALNRLLFIVVDTGSIFSSAASVPE